MPEAVACALCGSSVGIIEPRKGRLLNLGESHAICRCGQCGFRYLSPRPTVDELAEIYATNPYYAADNATRGATRGRFYHATSARGSGDGSWGRFTSWVGS